ncbi:hypothetical protein FEDK69T_17790 [Flavobacterium enshiense DK69]|uniref:Secretion system C-terminal sorting domain-containing protein n=1 Tax=Flavobacterium enshiense DK69 TaxID=1107311 RepID=V6S8A2_9FLAO|nr:T9SS type A sorting domain-containing protein [Flavobacterium enshiense]ESU22876.1 hypothetical protein FEDK69T_17790 [Flavobacterium enshiense DK69]KGO94007.1 hypothetical protein Q767_13795 [Flavobacterium enshiense DK69]
MKKIILFLLFTTFAFGQTVVDIRLVDPQIGTPVGGSCCGNHATTSNDPGLNAIFSAHGVYRYETKAGHPYPDYSLKMYEVSATSSNLNQFVADLNAYSNVVDHAVISSYGIFKDAVSTKIATQGIGIPTGSSNNIITTNDPGLNQIFTTYNVFYYSQAYPSAISPSLLRYYNVVCNCDNSQLKTALDNYTAVIEAASTEYYHAVYLLNAVAFDKNTFTIYPNPFNTTFAIESQEQISQYSLFDVTGKQLIKTTEKSELDMLTSKLNSGMYLLQLDFNNGKSSNHKIIKK